MVAKKESTVVSGLKMMSKDKPMMSGKGKGGCKKGKK